jgi:hypothetical protein
MAREYLERGMAMACSRLYGSSNRKHNQHRSKSCIADSTGRFGTSTMTSLHSAKEKLASPPDEKVVFPLEDLPTTDRQDPAWTEIRKDYGLSLPELTALKNYAACLHQHPPQPNSKFRRFCILVFNSNEGRFFILLFCRLLTCVYFIEVALGDGSLVDTLKTAVTEAVKECFEEQKTETAFMSKANSVFTELLLSDLGYTISMKANSEEGTVQTNVFDWLTGEEARTPAAGKRLTELLKPGSMQVPLEFVSVTGYMLRDIKKGKRKATGTSDLRVAEAGWLPPTTNGFSQTRGLVELKIESNKFSEEQLHLELVSVSLASVFKQGVALLATDCINRWGCMEF